ncbi:MAG: GDYXXLXY domain-containing protein [Bacillota bacterium]
MLANLQLKNKTALIFAVLLLQIIILSIMVLNSYLVIFLGEKITLKVEPVDPRSLFQGDYVILNYSFNNLDLSHIEHDLDPNTGYRDSVFYMVFTPQGEVWVPSFVTQNPAKVQGQVYIKGRGYYYKDLYRQTLHFRPGIEQFFVPEGKGKEIEDQIRKGVVYAQVSVYKGKARVTGLVNQ